MNFGPYTKSLLGAILIGAGVGLMAMAMRELREPECVDCGDAEEVAAEVAAASAEMAQPEETDAA